MQAATEVKGGAKTGWIKCATSPTNLLLHRYTNPSWDGISYESPFKGLQGQTAIFN